MSKRFFKGSDIVIFVYDITNRDSFTYLEDHIRDAFDILENEFEGIIFGNKLDLFINEKVKEEEGKNLASKYEFKFKLVSAKEGQRELIDFLDKIIEQTLLKKKIN